MKRKLTAMLLALALGLSLAACSGGEEFDGTTLTIMGKTTDLQKTYMTRIFQLYEETTGNRLKLIEVEDTGFDDAVERAFSGGEAPDLLMHFNNSGLNALDVPGNFRYLDDQEWVADLTDSAAAYCRDGAGNLLGLPFWESSVSGCYYNKTLLDSLGMKPASTQAEFDVLCQALSDIGYTPLCWAGDGGSWVYQFGLDPIFADSPGLLDRLNGGQIGFADIPEVRSMVEWIADAARRGWLGKNYLTCGWNDLSPAMSSGEAVMIFIWDTWFYTDFQEDGKYTKEDFALMPVFLNTADSGTYEGGNLNMMMVNQKGGQVDAALEFLAFCAAPDHYDRAFDGIATVNCFKGMTTNVQSAMVTDAAASIAALERVSTAEPKIHGYSAEHMAAAMRELFLGNVDAAGCVARMDADRRAGAGG